jgi:hypothetical protein
VRETRPRDLWGGGAARSGRGSSTTAAPRSAASPARGFFFNFFLNFSFLILDGFFQSFFSFRMDEKKF